MYSDKKSVLQLAALLRAHGIRRIVIAPGSRNIPLTQTFTSCTDFDCYAVTDERSAGFFALGLALENGQPAAVCCTSGSALLNLHPAVSEAYYQQVPLLVLSADRPAAWIGQMDGQTLPQPNVFGSLVRRSVNLPEVRSQEEAWHCNRLINEALLALDHHVKGPVHINIPISEPFFDFSVTELPTERVIRRYTGMEDPNLRDRLAATLAACPRRMLIGGQSAPEADFVLPEACAEGFVGVTENLCNGSLKTFATPHADALLYAATAEEREVLAPQLVITYGGHIVSKRLKQWIRRLPEVIHWHISPDGDTPDVFCRLSAVFEMEPADFFRQLVPLLPQPGVTGSAYVEEWRRRSLTHPLPAFGYSEMGTVTGLLERLARNTEGHVTVHLANSSTVRYAQLFPVGQRITVRCNRGVNGIEGSLSTAIGYAAASEDLNYILIGDLSFFYDMNALWNRHIRPNVRILLLNNGGGEIFQSLPGLSLSTQAHNLVTASHRTTARGWAEERGFAYQPVRNAHELDRAWADFTAPESDCPRLLEVFTDREEDIRQLKAYYHSLRRD